MEIKKLLEKFEEIYPLYLQENWDNSGLQVGNIDKELKGIVLSLDLEYETINKAIETGANLIINHHPLLFNSIKKVDLNTQIGRKIELLIKNDISLYACHTNLDRADGGVNDNLADILGLTKVFLLEDSDQIDMARFGFIEPMLAKDFAKIVKEKLRAKMAILYGDKNKIIEKIAICGGAGSDFIKVAINEGCDLIITGDIKYHEAIDAIADGLLILDPGHFASENHIIYKLKSDLEEISDVNIYTYSKEDKFRSII
ncbi:MAG: Nif3-like dinuclear metal center hexameric protein [Peptoniphilaceae bacterium]|nr:Nif3-like dinuclear metal center hexameric protein [Peptoniphilaceae bacterium]MDY6019130.1 Nif3-like dinuclear metal center hexameric protein [Anaerococcus sp.]